LQRCFVALPMSEEVLASVGELLMRLKGAGADVRWVKPEALHLTLKFLGEIAAGRVDVVKKVLREVAAVHPRFTMKVAGVGGFPALRNPRVVWAGISTGMELGLLQSDVEARLAAEGFEREDRPFRAHLTLGRIRSRKNMEGALNILEGASDTVFGAVEVNQILLMESRLKPGGAEHSVLLAAELEARG